MLVGLLQDDTCQQRVNCLFACNTATNLAYVRYFGNKDNAESATFKSINSRGFTVSYKLPGDTQEQDLFIEFKTPLTKREQIRPVLEEMAKEAESALGLVCLLKMLLLHY